MRHEDRASCQVNGDGDRITGKEGKTGPFLLFNGLFSDCGGTVTASRNKGFPRVATAPNAAGSVMAAWSSGLTSDTQVIECVFCFSVPLHTAQLNFLSAK